MGRTSLVLWETVCALLALPRRQDTKKREAPKASSKKKDPTGGIPVRRWLLESSAAGGLCAFCLRLWQNRASVGRCSWLPNKDSHSVGCAVFRNLGQAVNWQDGSRCTEQDRCEHGY